MGALKRKSADVADQLPSSKKGRSEIATAPRGLVRPATEPQFIRGGADALTPVERKKIAAKAAQDILFEDEGATGLPTVGSDNDENEDPEEVIQKPAASAKKRRSDKKLKPSKSEDAKGPPRLVCEGLTSKKLIPGTKVLGVVCDIHRNELVLSLPNNFTGYVSLTSISGGFNSQLEKLADDEDSDKESDGESEIELDSMFSRGQFLRAAVVSPAEDERTGSSRAKRIELSIDPRAANHGLLASEIAMNAVIQVEVLSIEDHGVIVGLGIEDSELRGFVPKNALAGHDLQKLRIGAVMLALVTGVPSNGKVLKLSLAVQKMGDNDNDKVLKNAPGIGVLQPGTAVEFIVSGLTTTGLVGKVHGLIDVVADVIHSKAWSQEDFPGESYPVGSKHKGRLLWMSNVADRQQAGISLLPHVLQLGSISSGEYTGGSSHPSSRVSEIIEDCRVVAVIPKFGVFLELGPNIDSAFVHISRLADDKVDSISSTTGPYMIGTTHRCRLLGYNDVDGLYLASTAPKILALPFLRLEDLSEGQLVQGSIERLTEAHGITSGILVKLTDTITGFVPAIHFSDVALSHPERKFRAGLAVTARVLAVSAETRTLRLTLKKTLVNSDSAIWTSYPDLFVGASAPGTLVKFVSSGAIIQFFGTLQGLLPASEMSESYITDPQQHFRLGQAVNVRVLSVDPAQRRLILTCREIESFGPEQKEAFDTLSIGSRVNGKVIEKTRNEIVLEIPASNLKAILSHEHLLDGSETAVAEAAERLHIGQNMKQLLVLKKDIARGRLELTNKPSLIKAAASGKLLLRFEDLSVGAAVNGYVANITDVGIFVSLLGEMTALLPRMNISLESRNQPDFGFRKNQSIFAYISKTEPQSRRITLSQMQSSTPTSTDGKRALVNPVDGVTTSLSEFKIGKQTRAKILAIKETQLNVQLADGVRGRIDVSELFNTWDEIQDKKNPLSQFKVDQELDVRVLGTHDSKTHRFLPISHFGKANVYELSAKKVISGSSHTETKTMQDITLGSKWLCFVNNASEMELWVNLAPHIRGRIPRMEVSDDMSMKSDLESDFPLGSALQATVTRMDAKEGKMELSAKSDPNVGSASKFDFALGSVLPAIVTKVLTQSIIVQLGEDTAAPIHLVDLSDDYAESSPDAYRKGQILHVCVLEKDEKTGKLRLSARRSRVLSSAATVTDREILNVQDLKVNDVVRGFVKSIAPNGIFVTLAPGINALVKIADISDSYIKDWAAGFEQDMLIKGKIIVVNKEQNRIQMSLKESVLSKDYKPPLTFDDVHVGDLVSGTVRKVADFGVFILFDNSSNVSGLCHRSELADEKVGRTQDLYEEGDTVRAVVTKIDAAQRRISLSMKGSQIAAATSNTNDEADSDTDMEDGGVSLPKTSLDVTAIGGSGSSASGSGRAVGLSSTLLDSSNLASRSGLLGGGFSWSAPSFDDMDVQSDSDSEKEPSTSKKRRRKNAEIEVDRTADLDTNGPRSSADFERLLLGQNNSSILWVQYMAFELQQGETEKARAVAERAVKSVNRQTPETEVDAVNVWVAYLNLENAYGSDDSLTAVFERACQVNDPEEMHSKLASVYIHSGKLDKADSVLQKMTKKFSTNIKVWQNYAAFLFNDKAEPDSGRELLPRALQSLPNHQHIDITKYFALLEFRSKNGQPERGRTIFEGLVSNFPKRLDLWNVLLDLEIKASDREYVRGLFERVTATKMKPAKALKFFNKWLQYEEQVGDDKAREKVTAKAAEFVKRQQQMKSATTASQD